MRDVDRYRGKKAKWYTRPGGTAGHLLTFIVGVGLMLIGLFLIMNQTMIVGGYWGWFGANTFGVTLLPLLFGVGLLFFDAKSFLGWLLVVVGVLLILTGVISNLHMYFRPTSLLSTLIMFIVFVAGLGLIARSLRGTS